MYKSLAIVLLTLVIASPAAAGPPQDAGHAVPSPGAKVEAVVLAWADLVDAGQVDEAFDTYMAEDFVEASHRVRAATGVENPGRDATKRFFRERIPPPAEGRRLAEAVMSSGDMVTIDGRLGQEVFLVRDGRIVGHWETLHQGAGSPRHGGSGTRP